jgi:hypothetical protein
MPVMPNNPSPNKGGGFNWGKFSKTLAFWVLIILIPVTFVTLSKGGNSDAPVLTWTQYDRELTRGNLKKVVVVEGRGAGRDQGADPRRQQGCDALLRRPRR